MDSMLPFTANKDVHAFFYIWYKNEQVDGRFLHWNHLVLEHWTPATNKRFGNVIGTRHDPHKDDIAADFWPMRGPYSSTDRSTMEDQFRSMLRHGIGTVVVSWWGEDTVDEGGKEKGHERTESYDRIIPMLMQVADETGMSVAFHLEPYKGRDAQTTKRDIKYLIDTYGHHQSFLRMRLSDYGIAPGDNRAAVDKMLPIFYCYDSYLTPAAEWRKILARGTPESIRDTPYDAIMTGLYLDNAKSTSFFSTAGFDALYTYFAATGFSGGSTLSNWPKIAEFTRKNNMIFIPSVGPGYFDENVRPWNSANFRDRRDGAYYDDMWSKALEVDASIVSITSYNEWHEGSQIEESVPHSSADGKRKYLDFGAREPTFYLERTLHWVQKFTVGDEKRKVQTRR